MTLDKHCSLELNNILQHSKCDPKIDKNRGQIKNNKKGILINLGENKFETKMTATVLAF